MFRTKDFIYPGDIANPSHTCKPYFNKAIQKTNMSCCTLHGLYVKVPVFCKSMCYPRGGDQDRKVRKFYDIVMLDFPGGNCYPCIHFDDAVTEIESAKKTGNPYAEETLVMMERAAANYWADPEDYEQQQG